MKTHQSLVENVALVLEDNLCHGSLGESLEEQLSTEVRFVNYNNPNIDIVLKNGQTVRITVSISGGVK